MTTNTSKKIQNKDEFFLAVSAFGGKTFEVFITIEKEVTSKILDYINDLTIEESEKAEVKRKTLEDMCFRELMIDHTIKIDDEIDLFAKSDAYAAKFLYQSTSTIMALKRQFYQNLHNLYKALGSTDVIANRTPLKHILADIKIQQPLPV